MPGVNGGGWLLIDGNHVDFLYRDLNRVRDVIERCVAGEPDAVYQLGHPMGFQNQIYVGETHFCLPIFDRDGKLARLKAMVAEYPEKMRVALVRKHLFDSAFHIEIAAKPAARADIMYVSECLSTATGFMTLVLYALNRQFYLNEKSAFVQSRGIRRFVLRSFMSESRKFSARSAATHRRLLRASMRCATCIAISPCYAERKCPRPSWKRRWARCGASSNRMDAALVRRPRVVQNV